MVEHAPEEGGVVSSILTFGTMTQSLGRRSELSDGVAKIQAEAQNNDYN